MATQNPRPASLILSLLVASSFVVSTGLVLAASPGDGHLKRNGAPMASQPEGQPDPDLLPLWAAFVGKASGPVSVTWSHLWGTPKAVYGTLSNPMAVSEASARQFLSTNAALLKLEPSLPGVTLADSRETPMGHVYAFTQVADGVLVYGAELKVHFNREGRVVSLTNTSVPSAKLGSISPSVKAEQAVESARGHVPPGLVDDQETGDLPLPSTKLVIYAETGTPTLAWEVIVRTPGPTWQLFVHA
jgi:Zn-dependent metalloprotease